MDSDGAGTTKDAIEAINYVINRKRAGVNVRVISASWGSTINSHALEDVIRKAGQEGILFVAAAGNDHSDNDAKPHYPASYGLNNVISVAALDRNDELTSFSNWGATSVDIAAPGQQIVSTWLNHGFEERQGTSMATPFVAGVAALILSTNTAISIDDLRTRLLNSVDAVPSLKGKVATGGRINAAKAVASQ
jgi:subtilisin family serine protease